MKKLFLIAVFIFIISCSNVEFVYKENKNLINPLYEKTEIVYHACEWDKNYLDEKHADQLIAFFSTHEEQVDFCFMKGMI